MNAVLPFNAVKTVATAPIGAHAIFADAIDDKAAAFYAAFGFTCEYKFSLVLLVVLPIAVTFFCPPPLPSSAPH